jgi:hypothetical protein
VIRDHYARVVHPDWRALDADRASDRTEEETCAVPRDPAALLEPRNDPEQDARRHDDREEREPGVGAVDGTDEEASARAQSEHFVRHCLRGAVGPPFMSKPASRTIDPGNTFARVFCDTFLFMLMLKGFCEAGHVASAPRHAYSIRLRLTRGAILV